MMENYTEIPVELNKPDSRDMEEMQKKLIDMITKNEKLKEKNEYLQKEVEDAKAVGERALCEVQELIAKNKRLVEQKSQFIISLKKRRCYRHLEMAVNTGYRYYKSISSSGKSTGYRRRKTKSICCTTGTTL